ncbi:MAG: ATP synthase subunit I [Acidimicrobiales bacterium]
MFERVQLPDVATVARRTMLGALVVGVLGLVVLLLFSQNWAALGLCIGIALGMGNFRLVVRSVLKVGRRAEGNKRRPLAMNTLGRLMTMTVIALVLAWVEAPLGLGIIGGLALFELLLLANVTRSMLKAGAGAAFGGGGLALLFGAMPADAMSDTPGAGAGAGAAPADVHEVGEASDGAAGGGVA